MPDGTEIYRAHNLREFIRALHQLPAESLVYHAQHNHFSAWLMARGEIQIAKVLKPYSIDDFPDVKSLRDFVVRTIDTAQKAKSRGLVPYFDETMANEENYICKLVDGSVGGKGRGIVFIHSLLENLDFSNYIQGIDIKIPRTAFIGIDEFEKFLESHNLWAEAFYGVYSDQLKRTFLSTPLSPSLVSNLRRFLATTNRPLAVRSSGLFEDMLIVPFSGIYETYIIPNNHPDFEVRLNQLCDAVRLIYASLFSSQSRAYFEMARYNLEEERMAVVIQELVGTNYGDYYYPHISGIAQSYNYYPVSYLKPEDGLCVAALGLGTWVVGGGAAHRFSPRYPKVDLVSPELALENTQGRFTLEPTSVCPKPFCWGNGEHSRSACIGSSRRPLVEAFGFYLGRRRFSFCAGRIWPWASYHRFCKHIKERCYSFRQRNFNDLGYWIPFDGYSCRD